MNFVLVSLEDLAISVAELIS